MVPTHEDLQAGGDLGKPREPSAAVKLVPRPEHHLAIAENLLCLPILSPAPLSQLEVNIKLPSLVPDFNISPSPALKNCSLNQRKDQMLANWYLSVGSALASRMRPIRRHQSCWIKCTR